MFENLVFTHSSDFSHFYLPSHFFWKWGGVSVFDMDLKLPFHFDMGLKNFDMGLKSFGMDLKSVNMSFKSFDLGF